MAAGSEVARQLVHLGVGSLALLLPLLSYPAAVAFGAAGVAFNLVVLPRLGPAIFRPGDRDRPWRSGIVIYPLAVLALVIAFPSRPDIAAVAWVILAAGDGCATLVGTHVRSGRLPWNPQKSWAGLLSFVICGGAAALGMAAWAARVGTVAEPWWLLAAPIAAAVVAGFVESAPIGLDDNIGVPAAAAATLWSLSLVDASAMAATWDMATARALPAVGLNAVVATAGWVAGTVTIPGALAGAAIGAAIYLGAGAGGWGLLIVCFLSAVLATRAGHERKARLGIAEGRGGRRGPGNAIANTGIAAWIAMLLPGLAEPAGAAIAFAAALVTGASDTVASEVGKAWGRRTRLVTTFRRVPPGTPGALSLEGTCANVAAALALTVAAAGFGVIPMTAASVGAVTIAASTAPLGESVLGATAEAAGLLNNDAVNLLNTAMGAAIAVTVWRLVH
jgi:uncharacterized protein (TIGR00297 family)